VIVEGKSLMRDTTDSKGGILSLLPPGQAGTSQISNRHSSIANQPERKKLYTIGY
jgi:hypothetical protein